MSVQNMSGQFHVICDNCGERIDEAPQFHEAVDAAKDQGMMYIDGENFCADCAKKAGHVCPDCGGFKRPEYDRCYECNQPDGTIPF